jgi:hypothetical protein
MPSSSRHAGCHALRSSCRFRSTVTATPFIPQASSHGCHRGEGSSSMSCLRLYSMPPFCLAGCACLPGLRATRVPPLRSRSSTPEFAPLERSSIATGVHSVTPGAMIGNTAETWWHTSPVKHPRAPRECRLGTRSAHSEEKPSRAEEVLPRNGLGCRLWATQ